MFNIKIIFKGRITQLVYPASRFWGAFPIKGGERALGATQDVLFVSDFQCWAFGF